MLCCSEALRESDSNNKDLSRQVNELVIIRNVLQGEKDSLGNNLSDAHDNIRELQARLDAANSALNQLKQDTDGRLRERDEELETVKLEAALALVEAVEVAIDRNRKLEIYVASTLAKSQEPAYSQARNQNKIARQGVGIQRVKRANSQTAMLEGV